MDTQQKLDFIEEYLKTYFDEMLIKDIQSIRDKNLQSTFPYILLVSAGIDFLGSLAKGPKSHSNIRSRYFIEEWLGKKNDLYRDKRISNVIYISARCGVSHQAIYKKEIESSSWLYPREKHLNNMVEVRGDKDRIFIHALQFVDNFLEAQKLFREEYIKQNSEDVYRNLTSMLKEEEIEGFSDLIKDLKSRGLTFIAEDVIHSNPEVKDYDKYTFLITKTDGTIAGPSGPPPED